ncbi:AarF/UbiB family protein [Enterovirga sp.]|uniref:ABC1 kinase family protein n=1 Tax=Enterovirga sp. TaxID=2026350 RepID=UPI002BD7D6F7|nr:AarF/UbiB family protein [Enterovirga sp.]HMO28098.1 AarF/UbiB family protein [Enterovirga sp.]
MHDHSVAEMQLPAPARKDLPVIRPLPRRKVSSSIANLSVALPRARRVHFEASILSTAMRLLVWLWGALRFYYGNLRDVLRRRDSEERRAKRLRRIFEEAGGTFAKFGQQLSIRADVIPYAYCAELSRMLDQSPPFPTADAIAIVERSLGKKLEDVFEAFDPDPIGSASISCVYQARLHSGERVAVKVRRPGIGPLIAADLRALDWLLVLAETLTIITPGTTRSFRQDLQSILFRELNFRTEARYTDLFRRRAERRKANVTAPKIYFPHCSEEVMVSEFVSGVWMWEIMAAVEHDDREFLAKIREQGIEPKSLASNLMLAMNREIHQEPFYHADPHPANLVVMPNNCICFIDFGAVGRFSTQSRKTFRELSHHMIRGDISRMVNASLGLAGPLPPIDVESIRRELTKVYADWVYTQKSRDAEWWERSMVQIWIRTMEVAQQYQMPMSFETIQYFRAAFSYDAIVNRLNKELDVAQEYRAFLRQISREARHRMRRRLRERLTGPTDADYLALEELGDLASQFMFKVQRNVEEPILQFRAVVGKIAYIVRLLMRLGYLVTAVLGIAVLSDSIAKRWFGHTIDWDHVISRFTSFGWVQLVAITMVLVLIRRIIIRLSMPDSRPDADR